MDFPGGSDVKESDCNVVDLGLNPGLGRSLGGGNGNPLQNSCLENLHGQRSLVGYSPWGPKELDTTERLSPVQHIMVFKTKCFLHRKRKKILDLSYLGSGSPRGLGSREGWGRENTLNPGVQHVAGTSEFQRFPHPWLQPQQQSEGS